MRSNFWKVSMGIATMIAVLFWNLLSYQYPDDPTLEPIPITADAALKYITLQKITEKDCPRRTTIKQSNLTTENDPKVPEKKELDYRQVISTTTQTHVLTVPRGESFEVVLCDGTEVWLSLASNFVYPTAFIGDERIVTLEGEAYFKVAKDPERPFIVKTKTVQTRVLGTEFNIRSYTPEDTHEKLINGKVEVSNTKGGSYTRLYPGEDAHLQSDGNFILVK